MNYRENPFFILGIPATATRAEIASVCDEKSLLLGESVCNEARSILTNPGRRLSAELHWFLDDAKIRAEEALDYLNELKDDPEAELLNFGAYCALSKLNILLAAFTEKKFSKAEDLKFNVLQISRQYETLDLEDVRELVNEEREDSQFPKLEGTAEIEKVLAEMRQEIRKMISDVAQSFPQDVYIDFVTLISESYSSDRYKGQAVLDDVISDYSLYIADSMKAKAETIKKIAGFISDGADKIDADAAVHQLIDYLYDWDELAQPMQLGDMTKGMTNRESEEILRVMRNLTLKLNNDYDMPELSADVNKAMIEVFEELPEYEELLKKDESALEDILESKDIDDKAKDVMDAIDKLKKDVDIYKKSPGVTYERIVAELKNRAAAINGMIDRCGLDNEILKQFKGIMTFTVRDYCIFLHNERHQTKLASELLTSVYQYVKNDPDVSKQIEKDIITLASQMPTQKQGGYTPARTGTSNNTASSTTNQYSTGENNKKGLKVFGWIIGIIVCISLISSCIDSESASTSSSSKGGSTTTYSTPKPTYKPTSTRPANGHTFYVKTCDYYSELTVDNDSYSDYYLKLVTTSGTKVFSGYVRANSTYTFNVPPETLELRMACGSDWYGESSLFGDNTARSKDTELYYFGTYTYSISFNSASLDGQTMDTTYVSEDNF